MKSLIFAECLAALKAKDFDFVESRIELVRDSPLEPAAAALYSSIRDQLAMRREVPVRQARAALPSPISPVAAEITANEQSMTTNGSDVLPVPAKSSKTRDISKLPLLDPSGFLISAKDHANSVPGVSIVAACKNREENLLKVLHSWLATDASEIIIVDWSCDEELWPKLAMFRDPRLKVIRIEGEPAWILTHALNVGLRFAAHEIVFKVDCDIQLNPGFLKQNLPAPGEFVRGFWRAGLETGGQGQQFINGTFGASKNDLRSANYYDERILTYGWDDSNLYLRFTHDLGLAARQIDPRSLRHLDQAEESRTENQNIVRNRFLGMYGPTEFEGAKNKYYTMMAGTWGDYFGAQDYLISQIDQNYYRGNRTTQILPRNAEMMSLAETLAISQLAGWAGTDMPEIGPYDDLGIEYPGLLRDAHLGNMSRDFIAGIKNSRDVYFIRCEPGPCRKALRRTLQVLSSHYPTFSKRIVLTEDDRSPQNAGAETERVLIASGALVDKLATRAGALTVLDISELESRLDRDDHSALFLDLSIRSLAAEVMRKAERFSTDMAGEYERADTPVANSCLVTSLYDEQNLIRLIEYTACVVENLSVFERVDLFYERSNGILAAVLQEISQRLAIRPGRLSLYPYQARPTFEDLFSIKSLLPAGRILAVANADVVFDASLNRLAKLELSGKVVVLSRRDISRDGRKTSLIRLENGTPNTFSADAWIVSTPFDPDFFLDYPIGTMHCDSFINHQVRKSTRYEVINPCLDVRVYHLHDDRFNSSAQKQKRDFEEIQRKYRIERERNGDVDPINGVAWSTVSTANIVKAELQMQNWKPKALTLNLTSGPVPTFGQFLVLHLLYETLRLIQDVVMVVRIPLEAADGPVAALLAHYQAHFGCTSFLIDIEDTGFDAKAPPAVGTVMRTLEFQTVADWVINGTRNYQNNNTCELLAWPKVKGSKLLCCDVRGEITAESTAALLGALSLREPEVLTALLKFYSALPAHSAARLMVTPYLAPYAIAPYGPIGISQPATQPRVTFITSLFRGGEFLTGFLENVLAAARSAQGEVIIVDANGNDSDAAVVRGFLESRPEAKDVIQYLRLDHDPGLYACWQIAIEHSRADLITNANIDDRRCSLHTLRLVSMLETHPQLAGACGSISCITSGGTGNWFGLQENQVWFHEDGIKQIDFEDLYRKDEHGDVRSRNVLHCMPVWRKRLHEKFGFFDEKEYGTSADWAFWLKCTLAGEKFGFDDGAFGQYYLNPASHNRRNDPEGVKEKRIIEDFIGAAPRSFIKQ